jgi:hypothetical protein
VGRRVGYLVAASLNAALLWIAHHLLDWSWPAFLTGAFEDLLPYVTVSLLATVVANLVWIAWGPAWFRHLAQLGLNLIAVVVTVRTWQIFPFDFSGYPAWWETVARVVILVGIVGSAVGAVVELVKLVQGRPADPGRSPAPSASRPGSQPRTT